MPSSRRPLQRTPVIRVLGLGAVAFAAGRLMPPFVVRAGGEVPQVSWLVAVLLTLMAGLVGWLAWNMWRALHKQAQRITSPHAVRMLALAKASIVGGALLCGFYAGFAVAFFDSWNSELGRERVIYSGLAAGAALLLIVAAYFLERACELPEDDDTDGSERGKSRTSPEPA